MGISTTFYKVIDGKVHVSRESVMEWTPIESLSGLGTAMNNSYEKSKMLNSMIQEKVASPEMVEAYNQALDLINWHVIHSDENLNVIRELLIGVGGLLGM